MDSVIHFEIPADDMDRAETFYSKAFGWKINIIPSMKYAFATTTETDEKMKPLQPGAINGGLLKKTDDIKSPMININVKNMEDAVKHVEAAGGKIIINPFPVGTAGISAYFKDTEGNVLGIWQHV